MKFIILSFLLIFSVQLNECGQSTISEPCYTDREVSEEIEDQIAECIKIGDNFFMSQRSESRRYMICNQNEFEFVEGGKYEISGLCYEIKPNERWPGTPFQLTKIKSLE